MRARSWLFVPANRPERFDKAAASGADQVILDLEDAVEPTAKDQARDHALSWLRAGGRAWVRTNGVDTPWWDADLAALRAAGPGLRGLVVPKATAASTVDLPWIALVETARGLRDVHEVAAHPALVGLAFGALDYALDLGVTDDGAVDHARHTLVVAGRAAGITALIDGVTPETTDAEVVRRDAVRSRGLGFDGKLCIHPAQIAPVRQGFAPTDGEVAWATRVVAGAAAGSPVFTVDGRMVDQPVLLRARRILALEGRP